MSEPRIRGAGPALRRKPAIPSLNAQSPSADESLGHGQRKQIAGHIKVSGEYSPKGVRVGTASLARRRARYSHVGCEYAFVMY